MKLVAVLSLLLAGAMGFNVHHFLKGGFRLSAFKISEKPEVAPQLVQPSPSSASLEIENDHTGGMQHFLHYDHDLGKLVSGHGHTVLTGVDNSLIEVSHEGLDGEDEMFVSFQFPLRLSEHDVKLGSLPNQQNMIALSRIKRWWQAPTFPEAAKHVPVETQLLLVELPGNGVEKFVEYAVIAPLIDFESGFRSTIYGFQDHDSNFNPNAPGTLAVRVESGDPSIVTNQVRDGLYIAVGSNPYEILERTYKRLSKRMGSFRCREEKRTPQGIGKLGACTWDTFYSGVTSENVKLALTSLATNGVPVKYVILDDGWQSTSLSDKQKQSEIDADGDLSGEQIDGSMAASAIGADANPALSLLTSGVSTFYTEFVEKGDPGSAAVKLWTKVAQGPLREKLVDFFDSQTDFSKRLTSVVANSKFENPVSGTSLKGFVRELKENFNIEQVYCWHALGGYWGGVSEDINDDLPATLMTPIHDHGRVEDTIESMNSLFTDPLSVMESSESDNQVAATPSSHRPVTKLFASPTPHMLMVEPALAWDPAALVGVGSVAVDHLERFYSKMHEYLADAGVDGVKVDAQSGIASFGGATVAKKAVDAVESSVKAAFRNKLIEPVEVRSQKRSFFYRVKRFLGRAGEAAESVAMQVAQDTPVHLVGCMCHSTENLYNYRETTLVRASDDFYPRDKSSQTVHLVSCAYNSLMLGEIAICDWDMFHSKHECAGMHAAARAVSGGPVYISDPVGTHDPELLRRLVLSDGSILRTKIPARPTLDCLFHNVMKDKKTPLKIWSVNEVGGVVGAFNVQGSEWDRRKRKYHDIDGFHTPTLIAKVKPADVDGHFTASPTSRYVAWSASKKEATVLDSSEHSLEVELQSKAWDVVAISQIYELPKRMRETANTRQHGEGKGDSGSGEEGAGIVRKVMRKISLRKGRGKERKTAASGDDHVKNISWSPIGLVNMLNCGGAVEAVLPNPAEDIASFVGVGEGEFWCYSSQIPKNVYIEGSPSTFKCDKIGPGDSGYAVKFLLAHEPIRERVVEIVF